MSDYDAWLTNEPITPRFCPQCMRDIIAYDYLPDEHITIAECECGWQGTEESTLHEWEVEQEYAIDRADMMYEMRREGLL